ncbi:MAG: restriction endonuclease subunit S [Parcubacteria group bacterium]|jgi:type I restriction enzyme S subunit
MIISTKTSKKNIFWQTKKLGEVCDFDGGSQPPKVNFIHEPRKGYVRFLQIRDFGSDKYITYIPDSNKNRHCIEEDILLGRYGASVGKILINKKGAYNVAVMKTIPNLDILNKKYFYFYLISDEFQERLSKVSARSAQAGFSKDDIYDFPIIVPPLPEQNRIVKILDEVFEGIGKAKENAEKNLQNAKELFDNYLHGVFTNNSKGWEFKKLSEVAEYFNGLTYSPKDVSNKGIVVLRSSNVQNDNLDFSDIVKVDKIVKDKIIVHDGDILMCSRNGSKRLVGKTATIGNLKEKMTFGTFMMIVRSNQNAYLKWFFKSSEFRRQITSGENTMINQITRYILDDVVISFPPPEERKSIVAKLDALYIETKKLEVIYQQKLADLEELKKSVLKKAFAGEL